MPQRPLRQLGTCACMYVHCGVMAGWSGRLLPVAPPGRRCTSHRCFCRRPALDGNSGCGCSQLAGKPRPQLDCTNAHPNYSKYSCLACWVVGELGEGGGSGAASVEGASWWDSGAELPSRSEAGG